MKYYIRAFAIGLFTASAALLIIYFAAGGTTGNAKSMSRTEMTDKLKEQGYRVVTESEYITLKVKKDEQRQSQNGQTKTQDKAEKKNAKATKDPAKADKDDKEKQESKTFTLHIASGMATSEISEMLQDNGIIKDANAFDKYLEKHNLAKYIQLGKHTLSSDMDQAAVAKELTK